MTTDSDILFSFTHVADVNVVIPPPLPYKYGGGGGGRGGRGYWIHFVRLSVCPSLSGYLLNHSTIFNQIWYGGVLSRGDVSSKTKKKERKKSSLSSMSRPQRGLI